MNSTNPSAPRVAVIGAGIAGASCAASLRKSGLAVTVFDKSRGLGGRMATRRAEWVASDGSTQHAEFDHGAQHIQARFPRFKAALRRAVDAGVVAPWAPRVHAAWPAPVRRESWVPVAPDSAHDTGAGHPSPMPALVRHLIADMPVHLNFQVQRLQRDSQGWRVVAVDGSSHGPFDQVLLAMPPTQAALLLAGHHDEWADALAEVRMQACWTLMAVTQDMDWPWDACEPEHRAGQKESALAWVVRNDRKPGRSAPAGTAVWVAQASAAWSAAHLESAPASVQTALSTALAALLPLGTKPQWQFRAVHRWRYAAAAPVLADAASKASADKAPLVADCWWDRSRGLGVCGDFMAGGSDLAGGVEAAWRSGDELADTLLAALDEEIVPALSLVDSPQDPAVVRHDRNHDLAHAA